VTLNRSTAWTEPSSSDIGVRSTNSPVSDSPVRVNAAMLPVSTCSTNAE
jgi:hypothetical protein